MNGTKRTGPWPWTKLPALLAVVALVGAACGGAATPRAPSGTADGSPSRPRPRRPCEPVEIEWYVGLGTGENEEQIPRRGGGRRRLQRVAGLHRPRS